MEPFKLTKQNIIENFNNNAYARGLDYYNNKKVLDYKIYGDEEEGFIVRSSVKGTSLYSQTINISHYDNVEMEGDCSCPVGYNCKHIVAVLLHLMEHDPVFKGKDAVTLWLDKFMKIHKKQEIEPTDNRGYFLIFRLFENDSNDFDFYKAKMLKNGSLSKGSKISKEDMFYYSQYNWKYSFLTEKDRELINYLKNIEDVNNNNVFEGEYGAFVLKKLCESGSCYFRGSSIALFFENVTKSLEFSWEEKEDKSRLVSNMHINDFLIPKTTPILCIDMERNSLCHVDTVYTSEELDCMLQMPELSSSETEKVSQSVLKVLPEVDFPLPKSFNVEEVNVLPKPTLYLYALKNSNRRVHIMELHFFYDDYKVNSYPANRNEMFFKDDESIRVIRNREKESEYREKLSALDFTLDTKLSGYLSEANPTKQTAIERWRNFMHNEIPKLKEEGWAVEIDETFNFNFEYMDNITVESSSGSETNPWFELSFSVEIGGKSVSLVPIVSSLLEEFNSIDEIPKKLNLELEEGRYLHMDSDEIRPILQTIFELFDKKKGNSLIIRPYDAHLLEFDDKSDIVWKGAKELQSLSYKLKNFQGIESVVPSKNLQAELREYQQFGLDWLNFLHGFKFGGILADDMGLGKTIQTLAFLQLLKSKNELNAPSLIVMPTSLIGNWKNEIEKFTPDLTYLVLYGSDRAEKFKDISSYDIVLTTYSLAQRDQEKYNKENFFYIILDEAQKIKNPKTKLAVAIKGFNATHRLALSGTPIENHLGELWSIFDFLMPGFLDSLSFFKSLYQNPIEQENDIGRSELLNKKIKPFILRRTKNEVVLELPPKTEIIKKAIFGTKQATLYENIRVTMEEKVRNAIKGKGLSRSHITILDALLKLRQVCCHPELLKLESAKGIHDSTKLEMFLELIDELHSEGRKVLVFSQFTTMLSILEKEIIKRKITYTKLTGSTRKRDEAIEKFTKGDAQIFLISLKAGGVGLNLVEADTVIHYDPWWNPAVENQATDRAYRIGQDKPVFVYKLIVENSIEEQILKLQEKKKGLQDGIYNSKQESDKKFTGDELVDLLRM